ncbi:hypothetical protein HZS_5244, partial [Henneguya salminicola]
MKFKNEEVQKYDKTDIIGEGSYATVYKGKHRVSGRSVALKQLNFSSTTDDHRNKHTGIPVSAVRELFILKHLNHRNILKLIDTFYTSEYITLVYEYLDQ